MSPIILILSAVLASSQSPHREICSVQPDTIRISHELFRDLTGDGVSEHLIVEAIGPTWKEITVQLFITSASDSLLYFDEWYTRDYFYAPLTYDPNTPEGSERLVTTRLAGVLDDNSFRTGIYRSGRTEGRSRSMRYALRDDLVEHFWRQENGKTVRDRIFQKTGFSRFKDEYQGLVTDERVEALAAELEFSPTFWYSNGHDSLIVIAWSKTEQRFVTVLSS